MFILTQAPNGQQPVYSSEQAAGADLKSNEDVTIYPQDWYLVETGVYIEMPKGVVGLIHPRSGLAFKHGITVLNAPGTIDSDYRGEIKVMLYNASDEPFDINKGDRIAQIVFQQYLKAEFILTDMLSSTERGEGGFGSTGVAG
jgi:dUTP pyrophosphatase